MWRCSSFFARRRQMSTKISSRRALHEYFQPALVSGSHVVLPLLCPHALFFLPLAFWENLAISILPSVWAPQRRRVTKGVYLRVSFFITSTDESLTGHDVVIGPTTVGPISTSCSVNDAWSPIRGIVGAFFGATYYFLLKTRQSSQSTRNKFIKILSTSAKC